MIDFLTVEFIICTEERDIDCMLTSWRRVCAI
jgi:hypothetical protein